MVDIIGFSPELIAGWYGARNTLAASRASALAASTGASAQASRSAASPDAGVIPPWDARAEPTGLEELARKVLASGVFFKDDEFRGLDASKDAKGLFSLHQGLKRLSALASEAQDEKTTDLRRSFLERRFQEGLSQFESFFEQLDLEQISLARGEARTVAESAVKIARGYSQYSTPTIHNGEFDAEVDAFQGDVAFTIGVTKNGATTDIQIDLADMGAAPRTMDSVADFINTQLEAGGAVSRFERVKIGEKDENGIIPGNEFGFRITGVSTEKLSFAAAGGPALYVAGVSGEEETAAGQLSKINALGAAAPEVQYSRRIEADPIVGTDEEGEDTSTPTVLRTRASAVGPGGELYVLAETEGAVDGVALKGETDLTLLKYDSTGRRIWSRVLGVADEAAAGDIAVGADGSVVVTGSLEGVLGSTIDKGGTDAFVAKYSATGTEQWLQRFGTGVDDTPTSLALGSGGEIYVGGYTAGALTGTSHGGVDGFVRAFDAEGATQWSRQIGGAETDKVGALAIADDGSLLVASVEDGSGKLTKYGVADGDSAAVWTHDLGDINYGALSGIAVDGGSIYLAGSAGAASALAGSNAGHAGGRDAFVMRLEDGGGSVSESYAAFLGTAETEAARDIAVADGAIYIAGVTGGELPGGAAQNGDRNSFVARLDAADGSLDWTRQISGRNGLSEAFSLSIDTAGDSVLDALGLPRGTLDYGGGANLVERTALRDGDHFYVSVDGGRRKKISIDAKDTYLSLTFKVNGALVLDGKAQVGRSSEGGDSLKIRPVGDAVIELYAGAEGRDALKALGLEPGAVQNKPNTSGDDASDAPPLYALGVPASLSIGSEEKAKAAYEALESAMSTLRRAWRQMTADPALEALLNRKKASGPPPAHLTAQLANFQAGLDRLNSGIDPTAAFFV